MSHPVPPERIAANRANASQSTGPRTPEGKARASQNARKHDVTASTFTVGVPSGSLKDLNEVANLRDELIARYRPVNSRELSAIECAAHAQQSILCAARLESSFFTNCLSEPFDTSGSVTLPMNSELAADIEICHARNRNYLLANGFHRLVRQTNSFALLLRYQAQAERQYHRAIEEFERLKSLREQLKNEPNSAGPERTEPTCSSCETNPILPENPAPEPTLPDPQPSAPSSRPQASGPGTSFALPVWSNLYHEG
jgi:predicted Zn-dependent protease